MMKNKTMTTKSKKAIIFDLDGVIVDTAKYHFIAWQQIAKKLGINFTHKDNELLKGVSRVKSLELILSLGGVNISQAEKDALLQQKNDHYLQLISDMNDEELLPGIKKLLQNLSDNNIPFALGSASKNARRILKALNLTEMFTAIVDGTDVSKAKPDPEVFLIAAEKLNYNPENCIVIEDSQAGIAAANSVNMFSIGIGDRQNLFEADLILEDTSKLNYTLINGLITE